MARKLQELRVCRWEGTKVGEARSCGRLFRRVFASFARRLRARVDFGAREARLPVSRDGSSYMRGVGTPQVRLRRFVRARAVRLAAVAQLVQWRVRASVEWNVFVQPGCWQAPVYTGCSVPRGTLIETVREAPPASGGTTAVCCAGGRARFGRRIWLCQGRGLILTGFACTVDSGWLAAPQTRVGISHRPAEPRGRRRRVGRGRRRAPRR
jgi:hypothetical protein